MQFEKLNGKFFLGFEVGDDLASILPERNDVLVGAFNYYCSSSLHLTVTAPRSGMLLTESSFHKLHETLAAMVMPKSIVLANLAFFPPEHIVLLPNPEDALWLLEVHWMVLSILGFAPTKFEGEAYNPHVSIANQATEGGLEMVKRDFAQPCGKKAILTLNLRSLTVFSRQEGGSGYEVVMEIPVGSTSN